MDGPSSVSVRPLSLAPKKLSVPGLVDSLFQAVCFATCHFLKCLLDCETCSAACLYLVVIAELYLQAVAVNCIAHHAKTVRVLVLAHVLTQCCIKILEDFVNCLQFPAFDIFMLPKTCKYFNNFFVLCCLFLFLHFR